MGIGLNQYQGTLPIWHPMREGLYIYTKVQDFPILITHEVHQPGLPPSGVQIDTRVEDVGALGVELGHGVGAFFWLRQNTALPAFQVMTVDPGRLDLLIRLEIEIGPVHQPPPVGMQLPAAYVVIGTGLC